MWREGRGPRAKDLPAAAREKLRCTFGCPAVDRRRGRLTKPPPSRRCGLAQRESKGGWLREWPGGTRGFTASRNRRTANRTDELRLERKGSQRERKRSLRTTPLVPENGKGALFVTEGGFFSHPRTRRVGEPDLRVLDNGPTQWGLAATPAPMCVWGMCVWRVCVWRRALAGEPGGSGQAALSTPYLRIFSMRVVRWRVRSRAASATMPPDSRSASSI